MNILNYFYGAFFGIYIWEYIARKQKSDIKPSTALNNIYYYLSQMFYWIGRTLAKLSSFFVMLDIDDLVETFWDIIKPIIKICGSPFKLIKGYYNTAMAYKNHILIFVGSMTLIGLTWYLYGYYYNPDYIDFDMIFKLINEKIKTFETQNTTKIS